MSKPKLVIVKERKMKKIDDALNESESQWNEIMMAEKNDVSNEMQLKEIL